MSNIEKQPPHQASRPRIQLRLMRGHHGAPGGVLAVPGAGCGLAGALELGGERLNDTQWRAANLCRVVRQQDGWQLVNDSPSLVCTHNGDRVIASQTAVLAIGDTLELGLLRFEVEAGSDAVVNHVPPSRPGPAEGATASKHAIADTVEFELRDLAFSAPTPGPTPMPSYTGNPFNVLDIAGVEERSDRDPLAELLGDVVPAGSPQSGAHASRLPPIEVVPVTGNQPFGDTSAESVQSMAASSAVHPATSLFNGLHDEFVRVVRDPTELSGRTDWEGLLVHQNAPAPTLEELSRQAEPFPLLRDILLLRDGIDKVIADFDPLGRSTLMDHDEREDVLALFAPEIARTARPAVPSLTRREHHDMSPDSHMYLGEFRPEKNESR